MSEAKVPETAKWVDKYGWRELEEQLSGSLHYSDFFGGTEEPNLLGKTTGACW